MTRPSLGQAGWLALGGLVVTLLVVTSRGGDAGLSAQDAVAPAPPLTVPALAPLRGALREPGLLVVAEEPTGRLGPRLQRLPGVAAVERIGLASLTIRGGTVTAAAVDPASYRQWSPATTARMQPVWDAVARGEAAVAHTVVDGLGLELGGTVPVAGHTPVRLGATASTLPGVDVVVNRGLGAALGVPAGNAALLEPTGRVSVEELRRLVTRRLGGRVTTTLIDPGSGGAQLAARLVGGDVAEAVGSFSYRYRADGTVVPDPAWVAAHLVTQPVPILGTVTCHRVMLPSLHGALAELRERGLAGALDPGDFGGCYAPRFIARDPARGLSLHTWGIAVDLNVAGNQVGTAGTIDRRVVETFERWGFAWGGRWRVPDPMHFELATLVSPKP